MRLALLLISTSAAVMVSGSYAHASPNCSAQDALAGFCDDSAFGGSISGDEVNLWGLSSKSEDAPSRSVPSTGRNGDQDWSPEWSGFIPPTRPAASEDSAPIKVTLSDLEHFRPTVPSASSQPNGWAVLGLPINFMTNAVSHIHAGTVLGVPAEVRFTPVSSKWEFGDGKSRSTPSQGSPWEAQDLQDFSPTSTSYSYPATGLQNVRPTVSFTAEYRFAGRDWIPVTGTVSVAASTFPVLVTQVDTILVGEDCIRDAPGC
jgi:hypothetical protein